MIITAIKFPNALMTIRTLRARAAFVVPNTFSKKMPAAICFEARISSFDAAEKYATLTKI